MKKRRIGSISEKQVRSRMRWQHATIGVPAGTKIAGGVKQANALLGNGGGGIEDATLPKWKRKRLKLKGIK